MIVLGILGMFIFSMSSIPFQSYDRSQNWNHPHQNTVGGTPPSQFTGSEPEEVTINAELRPEITGGVQRIEDLREMAQTGKAYPFILGNGQVLGSYVIVSIKENSNQLNYDGSARAISFSMTLKKVSDIALGLEGRALLKPVGIVRRITGI